MFSSYCFLATLAHSSDQLQFSGVIIVAVKLPHISSHIMPHHKVATYFGSDNGSIRVNKFSYLCKGILSSLIFCRTQEGLHLAFQFSYVRSFASFVCLLRSNFGTYTFFKGQRDKGSKGQRVKGTKGQSNLGTKGTWELGNLGT